MRRYLKRTNNGYFRLHVDREEPEKSFDKKTKLWISSDYLISESIKENPAGAKKTLQQLIAWNRDKENYEACQKLLDIEKKYINFEIKDK